MFDEYAQAPKGRGELVSHIELKMGTFRLSPELLYLDRINNIFPRHTSLKIVGICVVSSRISHLFETDICSQCKMSFKRNRAEPNENKIYEL